MDLPEILHEGQEGVANDLYKVLRKSDKTVSHESSVNMKGFGTYSCLQNVARHLTGTVGQLLDSYVAKYLGC